MKSLAFSLTVVCLLAVCLVHAQPQQRAITGDFRMESDLNGQEIVSILSLWGGKDGQLNGEWISYWGVWQLRDIKQSGNSLTFTQLGRFGDTDFTASFAGSMKAGVIEGTITSDAGELKTRGARIGRAPQAAGTWQITTKAGQREYTSTLMIAASDGKLTGSWQSGMGEHTISNVEFSQGKLTFDRTSRIQDRQWESAFEGTIQGHVLTGTFKSERGESAAEGKRLGAAAIGRWDLEIASESGMRKQLLRVNPDLSGMFGPVAIEKIAVEEDRISFATEVSFGEQKYELALSGTIAGNKLTGELTSSRGSRQVEGTKRQAARGQRQEAVKPAVRAPDVIYVPTPQEVVDRMLELARVTKDDVVYDLGCGDGRIVVTAAKKYGCKGIGYDINPVRVRESRQNVRENNVGDLVRIEQEDIFTLDLSGASVITLYLLPDLNVKLIPQLEKLKDGSRIVSHDFDMRGVIPDKVVTIKDEEDVYGDHTIYLWTTPLKRTTAANEQE